MEKHAIRINGETRSIASGSSWSGVFLWTLRGVPCFFGYVWFLIREEGCCKFQVTDCKFQVTDCKSQATDCKFLATDCKFLLTFCKLLLTNCKL